jgi:UDP-N-acetylmuramate--alanine ligase
LLYDKTSSFDKELIDNGIAIHFDDSIDLVPKDFFVENTLVIITPAVLAHIQSGIILWSENIILRTEVLGIITKILLFCCCRNARENNNL